MKRKIAILLTFTVVFLMAFAACGGSENTDVSGSKYVGTWKADSMSLGDNSDSLDADFTLTLNDDGTGTYVGADEDGEIETSDITWVLTDDGFKTKGDTELKFKDDGDNIKTKLLGVDLVFVRADAEADASEEVVTFEDTSVYGYSGNDPAVGAVYKYLAETVAKEGYEAADASIPEVIVVGNPEDGENGEILVWGNFSVYNYNIDGDTLKTASGGNYPGLMHVTTAGDGVYSVTAFDQVADGGAFTDSAKEIFGDKFEEFDKVYADDAAKDAARLESVRTYVQANNLEVTQFQDEGWDPIEIGSAEVAQ